MIEFFTDPVLRAPTWGTFLMCIASSLIGVILFLKKKVLLSESLSHATYPGVVIGISFLGTFFPENDGFSLIAVLFGAFGTSFLALKMINFLQGSQKVSPDSALCFVLALFFGMGIVGTSFMQRLLPSWINQVQMLLFGQAATMTDIHILFYGILSLSVSLIFYLSFHSLLAISFDRDFSSTIGLRVNSFERALFWLLLVSLILGIRSVGLVLMSGMIIAPAIAARQFTNHLHKMLLIAAILGGMSGLTGNILSVVGTLYLSKNGAVMTLPTGPMIVLVGTLTTFLSLLIAPKKGLVFRKLRIRSFRFKCLEENLLKGIWKKGPLSKGALYDVLGISFFSLIRVLKRLERQGWIRRSAPFYFLTEDGKKKAAKIVRLHRLWELYLADTLKLCSEKVHKTAEEMEHIITPDIEDRLTELLSNPLEDPHHQPIPRRSDL
jgi:manganese/zinc/iron transport system permease protein